MKLSFNLQEDKNHVLKAKLPLSIFNQPFVSSLTTTTENNNKSSQNTSFSLCTNFPSGPSLKLSYSPSSSSTITTTTTPFSLSLKSGLGLFGSPKDSPLVFSAQFSLSSVNPGTLIPVFSLHFKPQFGNFSFYKATSSKPSLEQDFGYHNSVLTQAASPSNSDFGTPDSASVWQDVKLEPRDDELDQLGLERSLMRRDDKKSGIFGGVSVRARTEFPVTKRGVVKLRWVVNLPSDSRSKMPSLTINKIGIEKVDDEVKEVKNERIVNKEDEFEMLKDMYSWMRRDLDKLVNENREIKQCIEDMKHGVSLSAKKGAGRGNEGVEWRAHMAPRKHSNSNEFEQWRSKKSYAEDNGEREGKKKNNAKNMSELESGLQKAIQGAPA